MSVKDVLAELRKQKLNRSINEIGFSNLPKGWDEDSVKKFAKSLTDKTADEEGFWTACYKKMKDEEGFGEEGAKKFCSALVDQIKGNTDWRTGPKGDYNED